MEGWGGREGDERLPRKEGRDIYTSSWLRQREGAWHWHGREGMDSNGNGIEELLDFAAALLTIPSIASFLPSFLPSFLRACPNVMREREGGRESVE